MVATVGSISIDLITNAAKFATGFKSAATTVDRESKRMAKSIATVDRASKAAGSVLSGFVGGIVAGGALAAFTSLSGAIGKATKALEDFEEIGNRAKTVGLRNDTFQAISFGALQADVSQEKLNKSLEVFTKNVGLARNGTGALYSGLKTLNPELLNAIVSAGDQEQRLRKVAEAFAQTTDATERAAIATAVFGKSGIDMVRVLEGGRNAIDKLKTAARDLGIIVPDELIERAGELDDKLAVLGKVIDVNISQALVNAAPLLVATAEGLAAIAKEVNATSIELTKFAENPGLDSLARLIDYFVDFKIEGGLLGAVADGFTEDAEEIKVKITELEQKLLEAEELGSEIDLLNRDRIAEDIDFLKAKLAELNSAAILASENSSRAAHRALAGIASGGPADPTRQTASGLPTVTSYERTTADNTERTAEAVEDQTETQAGYFTDLEETLRNDVTGGITKYIQQLIYAQSLAAQTISEAVRTSFLTGETTSGTGGKTYTSTITPPFQQTVYDQAIHGSPEEFANLGLSRGGLKMNYAGMFAEGGSFIAPGNQTGDTTRLVMDVNGGEKVTVTPNGGQSIVLNFYAAPGETEATMRQRARKAGEEIGRQLARA